MLRRPRLDEYELLRKLHAEHEKEFSFPDIDLVSSIYVVTNDKDVPIGFGAIQPIFESMIVLDQSASMDERLTAFSELLARAEFEMSTQKISQLHAFVQDTKFYNLLKKRYGFEDTKGKALVKLIGEKDA